MNSAEKPECVSLPQFLEMTSSVFSIVSNFLFNFTRHVKLDLSVIYGEDKTRIATGYTQFKQLRLKAKLINPT